MTVGLPYVEGQILQQRDEKKKKKKKKNSVQNKPPVRSATITGMHNHSQPAIDRHKILKSQSMLNKYTPKERKERKV